MYVIVLFLFSLNILDMLIPTLFDKSHDELFVFFAGSLWNIGYDMIPMIIWRKNVAQIWVQFLETLLTWRACKCRLILVSLVNLCWAWCTYDAMIDKVSQTTEQRLADDTSMVCIPLHVFEEFLTCVVPLRSWQSNNILESPICKQVKHFL